MVYWFSGIGQKDWFIGLVVRWCIGHNPPQGAITIDRREHLHDSETPS